MSEPKRRRKRHVDPLPETVGETMDRLRTENRRLRTALAKIAHLPNGDPWEGMEVARTTLEEDDHG